MTIGAHGASCSSPVTAATFVKTITGIEALAFCSKLLGGGNKPDSNAGRYAGYEKLQGATCGNLNLCNFVCIINLSDDLLGVLSVILGGLKSECENEGGTYTENLYTGVTERTETDDGAYREMTTPRGTEGTEELYPGATERRQSDVQCTKTINVNTRVRGIAAYALVNCKTLSGQLNQADSNTGRYISYVKVQGANCIPAGACGEGCGIKFIDDPLNSSSVLLCGLRSVCEDNGGTYSEKIFTKRTESDAGAYLDKIPPPGTEMTESDEEVNPGVTEDGVRIHMPRTHQCAHDCHVKAWNSVSSPTFGHRRLQRATRTDQPAQFKCRPLHYVRQGTRRQLWESRQLYRLLQPWLCW